ncbi:hypothetical protein Dip518_000016 [Parelusimicrobium proximum]|uniref:hypothetical protein n=1 Tax=Parelusimicrobium proximum TaxID=3228953 RepID=UPI003D175A08
MMKKINRIIAVMLSAIMLNNAVLQAAPNATAYEQLKAYQTQGNQYMEEIEQKIITAGFNFESLVSFVPLLPVVIGLAYIIKYPPGKLSITMTEEGLEHLHKIKNARLAKNKKLEKELIDELLQTVSKEEGKIFLKYKKKILKNLDKVTALSVMLIVSLAAAAFSDTEEDKVLKAIEATPMAFYGANENVLRIVAESPKHVQMFAELTEGLYEVSQMPEDLLITTAESAYKLNIENSITADDIKKARNATGSKFNIKRD